MTLLMWAHAIFNMSVVYPRAQTANPIWGELRTVVTGIGTVALWIVVDSVFT